MKWQSAIAVTLLTGCASTPKQEPVGRLESRVERGESIDVLAVSVAVPPSQALDRVLKAFEAQSVTAGSPAAGLVRGTTPQLLSCESVVFVTSGPGAVSSRGPSSCHVQLMVVWDADSVGTRFRISATEMSTAGDVSGSAQLKPRSKHWSYVRALARTLAGP